MREAPTAADPAGLETFALGGNASLSLACLACLSTAPQVVDPKIKAFMYTWGEAKPCSSADGKGRRYAGLAAAPCAGSVAPTFDLMLPAAVRAVPRRRGAHHSGGRAHPGALRGVGPWLHRRHAAAAADHRAHHRWGAAPAAPRVSRRRCLFRAGLPVVCCFLWSEQGMDVLFPLWVEIRLSVVRTPCHAGSLKSPPSQCPAAPQTSGPRCADTRTTRSWRSMPRWWSRLRAQLRCGRRL